MFFDSHCHLTSERLAPDYAGVLERAQAAEVTHFLNIADTFAAAEAALAQIEAARARGLKMWATAGVHPQNALQYANAGDAASTTLKEFLRHSDVVAVGEIGLDYFYDDTHPEYPGAPRDVQQRVMREQVEIALQHDLPVVIHNRDADDDLIALVSDYPKLRGVFHCFGSSPEVAREVLDLGFHLGFTGIITFKNAPVVREVAALCPLDRMLIETDAPYLAPTPYRGRINEPSYVPRVAETIGALRQLSREEVGHITRNNALQLFGM